jgi:hypothetical protein
MLVLYLLLHVVIIAFAANYRFVCNTMLIDCLYPLWIYFFRSFFNQSPLEFTRTFQHLCTVCLQYSSTGAHYALPLGNVALLGGWLVTTRSCCGAYLYFYFCTSERESDGHTHTLTHPHTHTLTHAHTYIHAHTQGRRLGTMVSCVQVTHGLNNAH